VEYTEEEFQEQLVDEHSVNMVRVNGMVQHIDAWYDLYNVKEGDALYLPADKRITIW
jgi:putative endopeptidase